MKGKWGAGRSSLVFGKPTLSNQHCKKCKAETLHKLDRCNHCGTRKRATKVWDERKWRHRMSVTGRRKAMEAIGKRDD